MNTAPIGTMARWFFGVGVALVILTHIYMLVASLPPSQMMAHAILNLIAAVLIILGWTKR